MLVAGPNITRSPVGRVLIAIFFLVYRSAIKGLTFASMPSVPTPVMKIAAMNPPISAPWFKDTYRGIRKRTKSPAVHVPENTTIVLYFPRY